MTRRKVERIFVSVAMRRSGQHAIHNWICRQLDDVTYLNCCTVRRLFLRPKIEPMRGRFLVYRNGEVTDSGVQSVWRYRRSIAMTPATRHMFYSFESRDLTNPFPHYLRKNVTPTVMIIVRDPFNLFASVLRHPQLVKELDRELRLWKQHLKECLGETEYLGCPFVSVNYTRWCTDSGYRRQLSEKLGIEHSDAGRNEVLEFGGGSSFDGLNMDGQGMTMQVQERWRELEGDERYRSVVSDPELRRLSKAYFDFLPFGD